MQFEQFQEKNGKNIINITVENDDSETLKQDAENYINKSVSHNSPKEEDKKETPVIIHQQKKVEVKKVENKVEDVEDKDDKYKKYQYLLLGGIIFTLILLVILIILYNKGI